MPELSNLLRQKLGADQQSAGAHPDPDLLTAFAEQLLPMAERREMLAHLAACAECREVLALSQPELSQAAMQPTFAPVAAPFWRRLFTPAFGLAASAAAIAVVAVAVLQSPQKPAPQPSGEQAAMNQPASPAQEPATSPTFAGTMPAAPVQPGTADSSSGRADLAASAQDSASARPRHASPVEVAGLAASSRNSLIAPRSSPAPLPQLTAGLRKQDYLNNAFFEAGNTDVVTAPGFAESSAAPQPQPSSSEARLSANAAPATLFSDIQSDAPAGTSGTRTVTPAPASGRFGFTLGKNVIKSARGVFAHAPAPAPAIASNSLGFSAMGGSGKFSEELKKGHPTEVAAAPEKPEGTGLERTDAFTGRSMAPAIASGQAPSSWRVIGGKLLRSSGPQWEEAYPAASFQFTFVNAHGNEIWAGGSNATLIHSRNAGASWETSRLGDTAAGDIVSIVFLGNNVQVKTSGEQSWSSSDGGKTWMRN